MLGGDKFPVFPAPRDDTGIVALGGELTPTWMLSAYLQGVFPWPIVDGAEEQLAWFSPDPRAVLPLDSYSPPKRLARRLRRGEFQLRINTAFETVVERCAAPRDDDGGIWLTDSMKRAYADLHALRHAHSIEVWTPEEELAGGVLGIAINGLFSAESMFHSVSDAGNAAIALLAAQLKQQGFRLLDIQQMSEHMRQRGAIEIPRDEYLKQLKEALQVQTTVE